MEISFTPLQFLNSKQLAFQDPPPQHPAPPMEVG